MTPLSDYLADNALAAVLLLAGLGLLARLAWRGELLSGVYRAGWVLALSVTLLGLGGLVLPAEAGLWTAAGALAALTAAAGWLIATGKWSPALALCLSLAFLLGLGGYGLPAAQDGIAEGARAAASLEFVEPAWLVLLALIPLVVRVSYRSLSGLGPNRRWMAIGLRSLLVALLVLALAELRVRRPAENVTVLFVVDRSLSIPQEIDPATLSADGGATDLRWRRVQDFVNGAVANRGPGRRNDRAGAILFARRARLLGAPSPVDRLPISDEMVGPLDPHYTDIAGAIKLALASFPEGTGKRIVLISDGNENLGSAEEQAQIARNNGVQIDTVLLAAGYRNENEVLVVRVDAPQATARGQRLPPVRVLLRNASPSRVVEGTLELIQAREGQERSLPILDGPGVVDPGANPPVVRLPPGLQSFSFRADPDPDEAGGEGDLSYTYRAVFQPLRSGEEGTGEVVAGLPGDRAQNNRASTHVIARGRRRVLFLEAGPGTAHEHLLGQLRAAKLDVFPLPVGRLPQTGGELGVFLSNFDCVVIANVPAELLSPEQQEMIRANTFDQGCGLVMVGGPDSYGAGGYQDTPVERALPVDCEIKSLKAMGKGGLVLVMHASEMADGNRWQKEIGKLAVKKLAPIDMVGVIDYSFNTRWYVPFQQVGLDKGPILALLDRMTPGDMPDFDPGLQMAYDTLTNPAHDLAVKHVIIISDGDPSLGVNGQNVVALMKKAGVTCTTVGVATHGPADDQRLQSIAVPPEAYYNVTDPRKLPAIYVREARRVSQSFLYDKPFRPELLPAGRAAGMPTANLDGPLPELFGFVRTTLKPSPLAAMLIEGPRVFDQRFPILAAWQYGLGRAAAFTSDARSNPPQVQGWDRRWAGSEMYRKFWEQTVTWALRGVETGRLSLTAEYRDGRVRVRVHARDEENRALTDLTLEGGVTVPAAGAERAGAARPVRLEFRQTSGGVYEAEFRAEEAGSYFVNAVARRDGRVFDSVRGGVTLPYSPEFAVLESDPEKLKRLSEITNGRFYTEDPEGLDELARSGELFRPSEPGVRSLQPVWYWLVFLAGVGLLADVAVRRVSFEPGEVRRAAGNLWLYLRHRRERQGTEATYLERLKRRKAEAGEGFDRARTRRRFEAPAAAAPEAPPGADELTPPASVAPPPRPAAPEPEPADEDEPADFFAKLKQAKRRAARRRNEPPPQE